MPNGDIEPSGNAAAEGGGTVKIVYFLYLGGIVIGLLAIVGVVMAYVNRNDVPEWAAEHYRFQIRTFWIGVLLTVVGVVATIFVIGWAVLLVVLVWWIVRCVKGLKFVSRSEPYPNVTTWVW